MCECPELSYTDAHRNSVLPIIDEPSQEWCQCWQRRRVISEPKQHKEKGNKNMSTRNKRETIDLCNEGSGANGKAVIAAAKKHLVKTLPLLRATKIDGDPIEKKSLDAFLFRCWQLGLLRDFDKTQPKYDAMRKALCIVKDAFETDVIYAPGESPTYEQADKAREVYKAVCDALGKKGVKKGKIVSKS